MLLKKFFVVVLLSIILSACGGQTNSGGSPSVASVGDPASGKTLFEQPTIGDNAPGCITCHSTEPGQVIVGPSLTGVATRAAGQVKGQMAAEYLRNSILTPNAYVVNGFPADVMYQNYKGVLTDKQLKDLVAYLLTFK